jgi:cell division protein ZapE
VDPTPPARLVDRSPRVPSDRLVAELVPPPRFGAVRFETYLPDPAQPSQAAAVRELRAFADRIDAPAPRRRLFRRTPSVPDRPTGIYLDGGFGVGKTHLLASLWFTAPEPKSFATFGEVTQLVGALGFGPTVEALSGHRLLCIDEFELDDPGDTVLVSTLLTRLSETGVRLAATSNTLPGALGEGRFAAQDFLREIQALAARFEPVRIEGEDYRHRGLPVAPRPLDDDEVRAAGHSLRGATLDDFPALLAHLSQLHPSRYAALIDGVTAACLRGVEPLHDQADALRFVALADRLYDREVPVLSSGVPFDAVFPADMLAGGYRKKYFRAVSRLSALAREGEALRR